MISQKASEITEDDSEVRSEDMLSDGDELDSHCDVDENDRLIQPQLGGIGDVALHGSLKQHLLASQARFLRHIKGSELRLGYCGLGDIEAALLANMIRLDSRFRQLKVLELAGNSLGDAGVLALVQVLNSRYTPHV